MKKLLRNKEDFENYINNTINPSYLCINSNEEKPLEYPCVIITTTVYDGWNDCIYYEFVYTYDFKI